MVPFRVINGYQALLYAMFVATLPFGLSLIVKMTACTPDNVNPRKQSEQLAATNPLFGRLMSAEKNQYENFPYFVAAVLGATQAGVANDVICMYTTFWLLVRVTYTLLYVINTNELLGALRSFSWVFSVCTSAKLLWLAAAK